MYAVMKGGMDRYIVRDEATVNKACSQRYKIVIKIEHEENNT